MMEKGSIPKKGVRCMKMLGTLAMILVVVGALNWGMVGLLNLNLVTALFGEGSTLTMVVYSLVGLSGLYVAATVLPKQMQ